MKRTGGGSRGAAAAAPDHTAARVGPLVGHDAPSVASATSVLHLTDQRAVGPVHEQVRRPVRARGLDEQLTAMAGSRCGPALLDPDDVHVTPRRIGHSARPGRSRRHRHAWGGCRGRHGRSGCCAAGAGGSPCRRGLRRTAPGKCHDSTHSYSQDGRPGSSRRQMVSAPAGRAAPITVMRSTQCHSHRPLARIVCAKAPVPQRISTGT